jgi:ubiquinone/menaquinone biosynthesis C-methylase UbiE
MKRTAQEMRELTIHADALARDANELEPVTAPGRLVVSRFSDYAHRLGAAAPLQMLDQMLDWPGVEVLDLSCGRGRWVKEFAARGATVTGIDISDAAIGKLSLQMPRHRFICADLTDLPVPDKQFAVVSSVTVIQHLPYPQQDRALREVARVLKPGGHFLMLENVLDFDADQVFPRKPHEWIAAVTTLGMTVRLCNGSNYEQPLRLVTHRRRANHEPTSAPETRPRPSLSRVKYLAVDLTALASYPVEWLCYHGLAFIQPSHVAILFQKT